MRRNSSIVGVYLDQNVSGIRVVQAMINAENINSLIRDNVEGDVDLLSIDIDRNDYWQIRRRNQFADCRCYPIP